MTKPWVERERVEDAAEVLRNGIRDWRYLDHEERHGTLHEALYQLTQRSHYMQEEE